MKASSFYLFSSMCGIAGYFTVNPSQSAPTLLDRMTKAIQHRGPDAHGVFHDGHAHLGHRRLSIVDLSEAGRQPMPTKMAAFKSSITASFLTTPPFVGNGIVP